ncbi:hypothetical protein ACR9EG_12805, partial [Lactococcus lactis]|uniref:hypothetical protein n=1 Tax=Lactococcus lactis TaxID=1358 RepID=UPI003EB71B5D
GVVGLLHFLVALLMVLAPAAPPPPSQTAAPPGSPTAPPSTAPSPSATPLVAAAAVCALSCDTLDPSRAKQETFPVPERLINGRRLVLHASDPDGMAWASIDNGV